MSTRPTTAARPLIDFSDILDNESGITTIVRDGVTYRYRPAVEPTDSRSVESTSSNTISSSSQSEDVFGPSSQSSSSSSLSSTTSIPSMSSFSSSSSSLQVRSTARRPDTASSSLTREILAHNKVTSSSSASVPPSQVATPLSVSPSPVPLETSSTWSEPPAPSPIPEVLPSPSTTSDVQVAPSTLSMVPIPLPTISDTSPSPTPSSIPRSSNTRTYPSSSATAIAATDEGKSDKKGAAAGAIVGGLLGCIAFIALILFAIRWYKRRSRGDKEALMRSSWFYGNDVTMPEDEDEQEKITRYWQSGFRAPSLYKKTAYRLSTFAANLRPNNRDSSRFPRMSALIPSMPGKHAEGYDPNLDVPPPMSIVPGQGGWATRFFSQEPQAPRERDNGRSYRPWSSLHPQPGSISTDNAPHTSSRPAINHPFAASASAEETDQHWGRSYSTSPSGTPSSPPNSRDLLVRNPSSSNSAYSGMAGPPRKLSPVANPYPIFDPRESQSSMEMLANTPTSLSTAEAKSTIIANLNKAASTSYPNASENTHYDSNPSVLFDYEPTARGMSQAVTDSIYSSSTAQPLVSYYQPGPSEGETRNDTMYSTASSGIHPNSRYSAATTATRQSYALSGEWTNTEAGGRETREWYNQPAWDESLTRNPDDQARAGMTARKSVKWNDYDDGLPRAL